MIRQIAFCAGFGLAALVWGTAEAEKVPLNSWAISKPDDSIKIEIDDLKDRVELLERLLNSMLPTCSGEPPEHLPCIEREAK